MVTRTNAKKKMDETVTQELLSSLKENNEVEETAINIVKMIDPKEAIELINCYEEIIRTQNERTIGYIAKQK